MSPSREEQASKAQPYLPHYEVFEALGEGAVATVYKVRHVRDGSVRALKSLKPAQAGTPQAVKRFEDEFRILKRLHHPSLPEVFDYGITNDGIRYIVMELVDGEPLDRYFAEHKDELWLLIRELTEALAFVHEHDLLHLDFKPDNALVKRTRAFGERDIPVVTLIDFGLSYQRDVGGATEAVGTAHYMSPEVIRREEGLTRAADYYSLGCVLYELVEGAPPFGGSVHDILQAHLTQAVSFGQTRVEYADLYPWIERLMSKEPVERLEAFQEFRRTVATRQETEIPALERAYALGYIESLGLIGKHGIWEKLQEWSSGVQGGVLRCTAEEEVVPKAPSPVEEADITLDASVPDLKEAIRQDLLSQAAEFVDITPDAAPRERKRYVALSGPRESGKSYMIETLRAELLPSGVAFVRLSDQAVFDDLLRGGIKKPQSGPVDPSAAAIDRFVTGWERLVEMARPSGVVVAVDDHEGVLAETREFVEYVIKRIELLTSEGKEPGIFFVVADESPGLKTYLSELTGRETPVVPLDIPPPRTKDIDEILSMFHGHMQGAEQRRSLGAYLRANLETDGAVMMSLREAVADDSLKYEFGRWQFHEPSEPAKRRRSTSADYYRKVFPELMDDAQTLVRWLCCHKGRLTQRQLEDLSLLDDAAVEVALGNIRPYRVVDVTTGGDDVVLAFVSEDVRQAFYGMLDEPERHSMHEAYVHYLEGYRDRRLGGMESLTYHYERAGRVRDALLTRVRAIRKAKRKKDLNAIRRLCNEGIAFVRGREDVESLWHVERFFIKSLIDVEWSTNNYGSLVTQVDEHFREKSRTVPLSFVYKYGFSLTSSGDFEDCELLVTDAKKRVAETNAETYNGVLLVEACMLHMANKPQEALRVLGLIHPESLRLTARARYYIYCMLVSEALGDFDERGRYMKLARKESLRTNNSEYLLRINYNTAMFLLNQAKHTEMKRLIGESIRLASDQRLYRSLCTMYFLASAVYHEGDNLSQALTYLDRAISLAADIGMADHVSGYLARYGLIYRGLGRYGTAIRYLEQVRTQRSPKDKQYFFASAILLDIHTVINSRFAVDYASELAELSRERAEDQSAGHYHLFLGDRKRKAGEHTAALDEYSNAIEIYRAFKAEDDLVRTQIAEGHSLLALGQNKQVAEIMAGVSGPIAGLESRVINVEYAILRLRYELQTKASSTALKDAISRSEEQGARVADMKTRLALDATLFHAYNSLGEKAGATRHFRRFYSGVKTVCSNLPNSEYIEDFVSDQQFVDLVDRFRALEARTQASD